MNRESIILGLLAQACDDPRVLEEPDLDLYQEDLLDSLAMLQFFDGLESELHLTLFPTQVSREELHTPRRVVETVLARLP